MADPDGMFSAQQSRAVTLTRAPRAGSAVITDRTAAAPAMSVFIAIMPSDGLSEMPPESNVMPLPTRTTCGRRSPREVLGAYASSTSRGGLTEPMPTARIPPKPWAASSTSSRTRTVTPLGVAATAWSASHAGDLVDDGVLVSSLARCTACAVTWARRTASALRSSTSRVTSSPGRSAATRPKAYAASARPSPKARTPSAEAAPRPATATDTRPPSTARRSRSVRPTAAPARRSDPTLASPEPTSRSPLRGLSPSGRSARAPARVGLVDRARWASTAERSGPPRSRSSASSGLGRLSPAPSRGAFTSETRMSGRSAVLSAVAARRTGSGMGSPCHANGPGTLRVPGPNGGPVGNGQTSADG